MLRLGLNGGPPLSSASSRSRSFTPWRMRKNSTTAGQKRPPISSSTRGSPCLSSRYLAFSGQSLARLVPMTSIATVSSSGYNGRRSPDFFIEAPSWRGFRGHLVARAVQTDKVGTNLSADDGQMQTQPGDRSSVRPAHSDGQRCAIRFTFLKCTSKADKSSWRKLAHNIAKNRRRC